MKIYYPDMNDMHIGASVSRLQEIADTLPARLKAIPEAEFSRKPAPGKWSKKEIIGHLVDSAANNHQRFIRIQYEDNPVLSYNQDEWNDSTSYNTMNAAELIDFWAAYNRFLIHILRHISPEMLSRKGSLQGGESATLAFYINDYVRHMEHHLKEVV